MKKYGEKAPRLLEEVEYGEFVHIDSDDGPNVNGLNISVDGVIKVLDFKDMEFFWIGHGVFAFEYAPTQEERIAAIPFLV